jgi:dipeptidase E
MKTLFLASSIRYVASAIRNEIQLEKPTLLFITTASEGESGEKLWLNADRQALVDAGCIVHDYSITGKGVEDIEATFSTHDCLCFEGGNVWYLLQEIQKTNCADVIRKHIQAGKIYIGCSAGSMVAGEDISLITDPTQKERAPDLRGTQGLGLVDISIVPHWGSPKRAEKILKKCEAMYGTENRKFILLSDSQYIHVVGDTYKIVGV